ncbi:hypothetical protein ACHQM5_009046 [Ranunculus cassubicifolius]
MFTTMFPVTTGQFGMLPVMPVQAMTEQATRHARRVYVGGLSPTTNEQSVATFFSQVMAAIGGNTAGPWDEGRVSWDTLKMMLFLLTSLVTTG